ncbi:MAG: 50S ribosomal protein L4 [Lentisphaerae bacterium RIFOXYA12_FULL_48_11]|nr:MAG: 50S ribosomal protein L4 [Lentisphaerae bacterium RIFOXYA12_FULL_48_11]
MKTLKVLNAKGESIGDLEIADDMLVLDKGVQAVHDVVVAYHNRQRSGTASTLRKGEVAGSNKKPWRQKGTGRARAGLKQSPVWRGGGVAFGPHPRSYETKINKKVGQLAFRRALSEKIAAGQVTVLDELIIAEPKTKIFAGLMKAIAVKAPALFVMGKPDAKVVTAAKNIPLVEVTTADMVNVYQLLRYPVLVADKAGIEKLKTRLQVGKESGK